MSNKSFLIIDDDVNIRKMLGFLIKKNNLGKVLEELSSGGHAVDEILFYKPDIVLIDLLLPVMDGIQIINLAKEKGYQGKFIMISQVEQESMISKAYESGIQFFISKPINSIEALNVIKGVSRNIDLEESVALIKSALIDIGIDKRRIQNNHISIEDQISNIFKDLGITSENGTKELKKILHKIIAIKKENLSEKYQLQSIYECVASEESKLLGYPVNKRTIEKRVRRIVQKSLHTLAELGHDDYYNSKFTEYSTLLFDFKQVKQEIRCIDNSELERGKISIKKFIEGIISKLDFSDN